MLASQSTVHLAPHFAKLPTSAFLRPCFGHIDSDASAPLPQVVVIHEGDY